MSKKHPLLQVKIWRQMVFELRVLFGAADVHMNHEAGTLIDCS